MSEKRRPRSTAIPNLVAALVLLLIANVIMAAVLIRSAHDSLVEQIHKRMLDVGNTAADLLDPEFIRDMQLEDVGSETYEKQMYTLRIFKENIDLAYIYAFRARGDGTYMFIIDPDPDKPAPFGYDLVWEPAVDAAAKGIPTVSDEPHADEWGTFYTAYIPIFDKDQNVVGIVGVDYDASMFKSHIAEDVALIVGVTAFTMIIGAALAIVIIRRNRKRYAVFDKELSALNDGFEKLNATMMKSSAMKLQERPQSVDNDLLKTLASGTIYDDGLHKRKTDEFTDVSTRLQKMQNALGHYITYLESQTYVDGLTGVGNKLAYKKFHEELDAELAAGTAQYVIAFFDVNGLRAINAKYTYEVGDTLLNAAATILARIFHHKNVFHVAGDEFIVILKGKTLTDMDAYFVRVNEEVDKFNRLKRVPVKLTMSKGSAAYNASKDTDYRKVFLRAEENEKRDKAAYYAANPKTES